MSGNSLADKDHVVRYVKPASIDNGIINGSEFRLRPHRPDDTGVSVNWLECFEGKNKEDQLDEIRRLRRLTWKKTGCLAELNIGKTKRHVFNEIDNIAFISDPLNKESGYEADPSHSLITGLPDGTSEMAELIGDMIAECILDTYPAIK